MTRDTHKGCLVYLAHYQLCLYIFIGLQLHPWHPPGMPYVYLCYCIFPTCQLCICTSACDLKPCGVVEWQCSISCVVILADGLWSCGIVALYACVCVRTLHCWLSECALVQLCGHVVGVQCCVDVCSLAVHVALQPCALVSIFFLVSCVFIFRTLWQCLVTLRCGKTVSDVCALCFCVCLP